MWYSLKPVFTKLFNFILVPVYTAYLTPEEYGDLQFVIAFGMFFRMLVNLGLDSSYWKFKSKGSEYSKADAALNFMIFQVFAGLSVFLIVLLLKIFLFRQSFLVLLIVIFLLAQTFKIVFENIQIIQGVAAQLWETRRGFGLRPLFPDDQLTLVDADRFVLHQVLERQRSPHRLRDRA